MKTISRFLLTTMILSALLISYPAYANPNSQPIRQDFITMLMDYSQYLSSGHTQHSEYYSSQMATLVKERQAYYQEFFDKGLHAKLASLEASFNFENLQITQVGDEYNVQVSELVKIQGKPLTTQPENYPLIQAANWALLKSDRESVKNALHEYIDLMIAGVQRSVTEGTNVDFTPIHAIALTMNHGHWQIIRDMFTDKAIDRKEGVDNVNWVNGNPVRQKIDMTQMPDYYLYHTSIEVLGQHLLEDYTKAYGDASITPNSTSSFTYNRPSAGTYIRSYTSNTSLTACGGIKMNTTMYNQDFYKNIWTYTTQTCNDCADYVSQALHAGGFPTDSYWFYSGNDQYGHPGSYSWKVWDFNTSPQGLAYYLQTTKQAIVEFTYKESLTEGDLLWDSTTMHVVMESAINPFGYSGHTNDRMNAPWVSDLNKNWHIYNTVP